MVTNKESKSKYFEAIGRRKTAIARVRITPSSDNSYVINNRKIDDYFPTENLQITAREALLKSAGKKFNVSVLMKGGGMKAQSEAMRLGISRALVKTSLELRGELKKSGFLKRDPRAVERKKFGLLKARKSPKWSKR